MWLLVDVRAGRLRDAVKAQSKTLPQNQVTTISLLCSITALLVEHCDFDKLRDEQPSEYFADVDIDTF
jgi:hypothetical protein